MTLQALLFLLLPFACAVYETAWPPPPPRAVGLLYWIVSVCVVANLCLLEVLLFRAWREGIPEVLGRHAAALAPFPPLLAATILANSWRWLETLRKARGRLGEAELRQTARRMWMPLVAAHAAFAIALHLPALLARLGG